MHNTSLTSSTSQANGTDASDADARYREVTLVQVLTLVVWLTCLAIGLLSWWQQQVGVPAPAPPKLPAVQPLTMNVEMIEQPAIPLALAPPPQTPQPQMLAPEMPPLPAVALPSPAIAFAMPVEGPVRIVSASMAGFTGQRSAPVVQRLVFGQNEPPQPKPEYPSAAVADQEQGFVGVRFSVASDGSVNSAGITSPSRWPLLNTAAVYAVLHTWHFRAGPPRVYDYRFTFQLNPS